MLYSMTGYGKAPLKLNQQNYIIELRSLNSKQADISLKLPNHLREAEYELRTLLQQELQRGKIDLTITLDESTSTPQSSFQPINTHALEYYISQLKQTAEQFNLSDSDILLSAMRMPDVTKSADNTTLTEQERTELTTAVKQAVKQFNDFRIQEGKSLEQMFSNKLDDISNLLLQVEPLEKERIEKIRERLENSLQQLSQQTQQQIDNNRLEQEMIYYLEKLDINEEKVRLRNHIAYFRQTMQETQSVGKKLGFIAQEMGREINTLGSKSNHAQMQIIVVKMKDVLEQIKEQVLNVL